MKAEYIYLIKKNFIKNLFINVVVLLLTLLLVYMLIFVENTNLIFNIFSTLITILIVISLIYFTKSTIELYPPKLNCFLNEGELISFVVNDFKFKNEDFFSKDKLYIFCRSKQLKLHKRVEDLFYTDKIGVKSETIDVLYFSETESFIILNLIKVSKIGYII